jgi:hypothetical protein
MCNGRFFSLKDVARIVKEVATTATELNDNSKAVTSSSGEEIGKHTGTGRNKGYTREALSEGSNKAEGREKGKNL